MSDDEESQAATQQQQQQQQNNHLQFHLQFDAPMSDRVQSLASRIYTELESLMRRYDDDVVKELMPLIVGVLEGMERAISERRSQEAELEMLREDHDQLLAQFERERRERKAAEERLMLAEDAVAEERAKRVEEREASQAASRLLELKARNAHELANRLEEKEAEARREFQRLHERHSELLRSHTEHVDRTRAMMAAAAAAEQPRPSPLAAIMHSRRRQRTLDQTEGEAPPTAVAGMVAISSGVRVGGDFDDDGGGACEEEPDLDDIDVIEQDEQGFVVPIARAVGLGEEDEEDGAGEVVDVGGLGDGGDIDGRCSRHTGCHRAGVDREIENLIKENMDLIETKNALNIVKDDLIAKVDELTGEKELLRDEVDCLQNAKTALKERMTAMEEETRSLKEEVEKLKARLREQPGDEDDASVPMSQRKRFTRVEMSRVLMERNEYKERLMELQEAVRYAELMRANRDNPEGTGRDKRRTTGNSVWGFFNSLWGAAVGPDDADADYAEQQQQQQHLHRPAPAGRQAANVLLQPLMSEDSRMGGTGEGSASHGGIGQELHLLPPKPPGTAQPKPLVLVPPMPVVTAPTASSAVSATAGASSVAVLNIEDN